MATHLPTPTRASLLALLACALTTGPWVRVRACSGCGRRPYRHGRHWGGPASVHVAGDVRAHAGRCHDCAEDIERTRHGLLGVLVRRRVQVAGKVATERAYEGGASMRNPPPSMPRHPVRAWGPAADRFHTRKRFVNP